MDFNQIQSFIDLVKDPKKYEAKLKSLKDETAKLNEAIETVGKASEIQAMYVKAEATLSKAKGELEDAKDKAIKIIAQAQEDAEQKRLVVLEREKKLHEQKGKVNKMELDAEEALKAAKEAEVVAEKERDVVLNKKAALDKKQAEIDAKLAKLKEII